MVNKTSKSSIFLTLILYSLQGINLGLTSSIPLFLIYYGATWKDRGTFNFCFYPFSFKLLWAPLIDVFYIKKFGRRKSWLIPILLLTSLILFILSFYIELLIITNRIFLLTILFFLIIFLTATEDICVDGLAITLFTLTNPQWASTSQAIGQTFGRFIGSSFLLTFESANFTNKYFRQPFSFASQTTGLFTIRQFICSISILFLIVSLCILIFIHEKEDKSLNNNTKQLSLRQTYLSLLQLLKKNSIQQLTLISLTAPIGLVAIYTMTPLELINQGVSRENLALVNIPVALVTMITPLIIRHTEKALIWFSRSYRFHLLNVIPLIFYVYFTPYLISFIFYYPILILLLLLNEFIRTLLFTAHVGFFASICESRIGGTYMTFLVTISNLGAALNSSIILYLADFLPKKYSYLIVALSCTFLGFIWILVFYKILKKLQNIPIHKWHLIQQPININISNDCEKSFISNKQIQEEIN